MRIRWLGNSCVEFLGEKHFLIDPNFLVEPEGGVNFVLVTHEHIDHFDVQKFRKLNARLIAPYTVLSMYNLDGMIAKVGEEFEGVKVYESWCLKSEESVSYFYEGVLHAGDSARFPEVEGVKLVFTACFPDFYEDYVNAFMRLKPEIVVPFHFSEQKRYIAEDLKKKLDNKRIKCRILRVGESIEI
ncbi:MAG: MBL fold metallo-hydrolase [Candidatus Jordarchaeaceae archaeon]